jgi:hypothetical protein
VLGFGKVAVDGALLIKQYLQKKITMITDEEKNSILNTYKWIKVPKFVDDDTLSWEERYQRLMNIISQKPLS